MRFMVVICFALLVLAAPAYPQTGAPDATNPDGGIASFLERWDDRSLQSQLNQPNWLTPVITSTARLKQEIRYDISWQRNADGTTAENYGGSRGFTTIPVNRIEVSVNLPPYIVHHQRNLHDGFGDLSFLAKFRILAGNRAEGDYVLTAFLAVSVPTGSYKNGSPHPVITPTIAGGKGLGDFVYQGTLGSDLPGSQTALLGRRLILNNAIQYRGFGKVWPEMEVNSNFYNGGPNDGRKQVFLTPGLSAGRFMIYRHLQLSMGAGMEIAVTRFHSYAHQAVFTARLPF
jgi:hypothetical protein